MERQICSKNQSKPRKNNTLTRENYTPIEKIRPLTRVFLLILIEINFDKCDFKKISCSITDRKGSIFYRGILLMKIMY
jgi:hypothetical protein